MPTYDYVCRGCDHAFEEFQSMSARPLKKCPECGERKLERLIGTGAGVIFKGGGFYETDYRSESYKKGAEAEKKSADSGGSDSGDKASKTAAADTPAKKETPASTTGKTKSNGTKGKGSE
mgnify:CR=1 FL=1